MNPPNLDKTVAKILDDYASWIRNYHTTYNQTIAKQAIIALIESETKKARIEELNSLDHNKQMFGDWQQVIENRIKELKDEK